MTIHISEVKPGDWIYATMSSNSWGVRGYYLAQVERLTKTQIVARKVPTANANRGGDTVRILRRNGDEVGYSSSMHRRYWQHTPDPDSIRQKAEDVEAEKAKQAAESRARHQARIDRAKAANPELHPIKLPMGVQLIEWLDSRGERNLLFYTWENERDWDGQRVVRLKPVSYGPTNFSSGWSTHSSVEAPTVEEAIYLALSPEFSA